MPTYVSAQYVLVEDPPPAQMRIRAVDDTGAVWWMGEDCDQSDWLDFLAQGNEVTAAETPAPEEPS